MAKRGPFIVERIEYNDLALDGRMTVRVREYPAGALVEFDLEPYDKSEVLKLLLRAHARKVDQLNLKAMEGNADG